MKERKDVQVDWHFFYNKNENTKSKFLLQKKKKRIENIKKENYSIDQLSVYLCQARDTSKSRLCGGKVALDTECSPVCEAKRLVKFRANFSPAVLYENW